MIASKAGWTSLRSAHYCGVKCYENNKYVDTPWRCRDRRFLRFSTKHGIRDTRVFRSPQKHGPRDVRVDPRPDHSDPEDDARGKKTTWQELLYRMEKRR